MADAETTVTPGKSRMLLEHDELRRLYDLGVLKIVYRAGRPPAYELLNQTKFPEIS